MRTFVELVERYVDPELCPYPEYKGKPNYSIKYIENGEEYVGYSTYSLRVMSGFLKKYFISSALEKQEQDRWIPVTERLPEKDCECRVTEGDFKSVFDCHWNNHKKQFEVWSYYHDDYVPITNVTAWKPLEEPYTEEEA